MANDIRLTISELSFPAAVAAAEAIRLGATQPFHAFSNTIPSFMLDVTAVSGVKKRLFTCGFQYVPMDTQDDSEWMVWLPEDLRNCWNHAYECDCMECRDICCCGEFQRRHVAEDHYFTSAYWYYKIADKQGHGNHEAR